MLCPSLSYTNIMLLWLLFTKKLWKLLKHSTALPNFVHVSLSISELHENASSHCSLLWYEKAFVYQQIITTVVVSHETLYRVSIELATLSLWGYTHAGIFGFMLYTEV